MVILMIRWCDHAHAELRSIAAQQGKLFVSLPAGYGVNQVAHQIVTQVGDQLENHS